MHGQKNIKFLEPMLTFTTHSIQTTQCCVSTNNKVTPFTVQGVKKNTFSSTT